MKTFGVSLSNVPKALVIALCVALALVIVAVYHLTGSQLAVSTFYVLPVAIATWAISRPGGIIVSVFCVLTWLIADLLSGNPYAHQMIPYVNAVLRLSILLVVVFILSALRQALLREATSARQDTLTHLANRRAFQELAEIEISRAKRTSLPFTVIFIDIDNFKVVNDRFGHLAGDKLLKLTADTMRRNVRAADIVARLGGDEFVILLVETDSESARNALDRLKADLLSMAKAHTWPVNFSTGVFTYTTPPQSVEEMLRKTDELMYGVKNAARAQYRTHNPQ